MKYAIIAAGEGSRLTQEGVNVPKPLVQINGEALIDRLIRIFSANGATEIVVIVNNLTTRVQEHLRGLSTAVPLRMVVKTTPSSMHSFFEISPFLKDERFCLTTVDTIFREDEFAAYIREFERAEGDGLMAVTDFVDDERPLYVSTDEALRITGFHDSMDDFRHSPVVQTSVCQYISGGIYCLTPPALNTLARCMAEGQSRMRNFQRQLVADGLSLKARPFSKILDVDHADDIDKAEKFVTDKSND